MRSQKWLIIVFIVLCLNLLGLEAKTIVINDNEAEKTIQCQGDDVVVNGNGNILKIKGECSKLSVRGNENTIRVQAVASIDALGNENRITWETGVNGNKPSISNLGTDNTVKKASPQKKEEAEEEDEESEEEEESEESEKSSDDLGVKDKVEDALSKLDILEKGQKESEEAEETEPSGKIEIDQNRLQKTLTLQGEKLIVNGNFNQLTVKGFCSVLEVRGNSNLIHITSVGTIKALGNINSIFWQKGLDEEKPKITNLGMGNKINHGEDE